MPAENIFLGNDNTIDWQLQADGVALNLSSVTRMTAEVAGCTLDSNTDGNAVGNTFYWIGGIPAANEPNVYLKLGPALNAAGAAKGTYSLRLRIFDPDNQDGIVVVDNASVRIS